MQPRFGMLHRLDPLSAAFLSWLVLLLTTVSTTLAWPGKQGPRPSAIEDTPLDWNLADGLLFARLGRHILAGHLEVPYADPVNQAGPAQLVADGLLSHLAGLLGGYPLGAGLVRALICGSTLAAFVAVAVILTRPLLAAVQPGSRQARVLPWAPAASGILATALAADDLAYMDGHWWQVPVLLLWWKAGALAQQNKPVSAGALIGVSAWFEPWGVLGAVTLLLAPRLRPMMVAGLTAAVTTMAGWLPFLLQPVFALPQYQWGLHAKSLWHLALPAGEGFPWTARLTQSVIIVVVSAVLTWRARQTLPSLWAAWIAPLFIVLMRMSTDVWWAPYYNTCIQVFLLPAAVALAVFAWRRGILLVAAIYLFFLGWVLPTGPFLTAGLCLAILCLAMLRAPGWLPSTDPAEPARR